jgi:hypothetical protein
MDDLGIGDMVGANTSGLFLGNGEAEALGAFSDMVLTDSTPPSLSFTLQKSARTRDLWPQLTSHTPEQFNHDLRVE